MKIGITSFASADVIPQVTFVVKPWGTYNSVELWNSVSVANTAQNLIIFKPDYDELPLNPDRYRLPDGGLDLAKAIKDLVCRSQFKHLTSYKLILITEAPYSELGSVPTNVEVVSTPGFFFQTDVLGDQKISIVSTFLWDRLPVRPELDVLAPSGRRAWQPYLLLAFASIALDNWFEMGSHDETLACPNDYCHNIIDIDKFFERGRWFCEKYCDPILKENIGAGKLRGEQAKAIKRLLNKAHGRPANDGYDSCFISYGGPDKKFAKKLYNDLKDREIECWIYDEDSLPGDTTWVSINVARSLADRVLMICSSLSLKRRGVLKELETQIDENPYKIIPIAVDKGWLPEEFHADRGLINLMPFLRERNYADFAEMPYQKAIERLIKALKWK